jgi:hypothetical protein
MGRAASPSAGINNLGNRVSRVIEVAITTAVGWAFGMATAAALVYLAMGLYTGDRLFASPMVLLDPQDASHPWGLSFTGMQGAYIAVGMAVGAMAACGMTMMFSGLFRRLGLLALIFWSGMWAADAVLLLSQNWNTGGATGNKKLLMAAGSLLIIFACMLHRAWRVWRVHVTV